MKTNKPYQNKDRHRGRSSYDMAQAEPQQDNVIYGIHAVKHALANRPQIIKSLLLNQSRHDTAIASISELATAAQLPIQWVTLDELQSRYPDMNHQGVVALLNCASTYNERDIPELLKNCKSSPFILILDCIQDPHNLGACLRSSEVAGVDFVVIPNAQSAGITPVVRKVASGAADLLPIVVVSNLARVMRELQEQGVWLYGADGEATQSVFQTKFDGAVGIVLGSEGSGMRRLTREHCDALISIPMQGSIASLNVSVAAGICLFEVVRQRLAKK